MLPAFMRNFENVLRWNSLYSRKGMCELMFCFNNSSATTEHVLQEISLHT